MCDLEGIGVSLIFRLIHSVTDLVRTLPTLDLIWWSRTPSVTPSLIRSLKSEKQ